jgi:amidase
MDKRRFLKRAAIAGAAYALPLTMSRGLFAADMPANLVDFTASDLSTAIRDKHASCVEVMQAYLQHIHTYNPAYNAIISMVDEDELIHQAGEAD